MQRHFLRLMQVASALAAGCGGGALLEDGGRADAALVAADAQPSSDASPRDAGASDAGATDGGMRDAGTTTGACVIDTTSTSGNARAVLEYDEAGRKTSVEYDYGVDGIVELRLLRAYDAAGRVVLYGEDPDDDGIVDKGYLHTYDPLGNMLVREQFDGASILDRITWTYDGARVTGYDWDRDGDGDIDERTLVTYAPDGSWDRSSSDIDANGTIDTTQTQFYRGTLVVRAEHDYEADGIADSAVSYTYDAADRLILTEQDYQADGTIQAWERLTRDASGRVIRREVEQDTDPALEHLDITAYDDLTYTTQWEYDDNADGSDLRHGSSAWTAGWVYLRRFEGDTIGGGYTRSIWSDGCRETGLAW